jgi:hypothetical protein
MLRPHGPPGARPLVWLTDLDVALRDALGLTSQTLTCDRTRHRYRVIDVDGCAPYIGHPLRSELRALEQFDGVRPKHWWLSMRPVPVVYDPVGAQL